MNKRRPTQPQAVANHQKGRGFLKVLVIGTIVIAVGLAVLVARVRTQRSPSVNATSSQDSRRPSPGAMATTTRRPFLSRPSVASAGTAGAPIEEQGVAPAGELDGGPERWIDAFPASQRAPADDGPSILAMLSTELGRLYGPDEQSVTIDENGNKKWSSSDVLATDIESAGLFYVETETDGLLFDHILAPYRDKRSRDIAVIVTLLVRDGVAAAAEYATYPKGNRPPTFPFLSQTDAVAIISADFGPPKGEPAMVFSPSPVSPKPMLFVYRFDTDVGERYVSQDGVIWSDLASMQGPF